MSKQITIDDFHVKSKGWFEQIYKVPDGFEMFFSSAQSKYYTNKNKDTIVRESDHWGYRIKLCTWYLKGYPDNINSKVWQKFFGKDYKIGIIRMEDLVRNSWSKDSMNMIQYKGLLSGFD